MMHYKLRSWYEMVSSILLSECACLSCPSPLGIFSASICHWGLLPVHVQNKQTLDVIRQLKFLPYSSCSFLSAKWTQECVAYNESVPEILRCLYRDRCLTLCIFPLFVYLKLNFSIRMLGRYVAWNNTMLTLVTTGWGNPNLLSLPLQSAVSGPAGGSLKGQCSGKSGVTQIQEMTCQRRKSIGRWQLIDRRQKPR